jgi:hypothetical protein
MDTKIFENKFINWPLFSIKITLFISAIGIVYSILKYGEISLTIIFIIIALSLGSIITIYLTHISKIVIENGVVSFIYMWKKTSQPLSQLNVTERNRTQGMIKSQELIFNIGNKRIKISSREWPSFDKIKDFFIN